MNERIRELALQAGYEADMFGIGHWDMPECKKFAELIVRECARVAARTECPYTDEILRKQHGHTWDMACVAAAEDIRLHFGVER
jgi:hypothetical protein